MKGKALRFGTSGLRGLVTEMTDYEVYLNSRAFFSFLELNQGPLALAEDLRERCSQTGMESSPRIARAVLQAARDAGFSPVHCGKIPTPALASYALNREIPAVMITGSHIPGDRNGVKFYKSDGEVLKSDEEAIMKAVERWRADAEINALFDAEGAFVVAPEKLRFNHTARDEYKARYASLFDEKPLKGQIIVLYEHTAVGRELTREIFEALGAEIIPVGRSDKFVPIDTEDISAAQEKEYRSLVKKHQADALISTDGDGDRPLLIDERGAFHRGDVLGALTTQILFFFNGGPQSSVSIPISCSDAVDRFLVDKLGRALHLKKTRIGSPYVIEAMQHAPQSCPLVVGWEANGGYLTHSQLKLGTGSLSALPTRDAMLPLIAVLSYAAKQKATLSSLFAQLPKRYTRAGLLDEIPPEQSQALVKYISPKTPGVQRITNWSSLSATDAQGQAIPIDEDFLADWKETQARIAEVFAPLRPAVLFELNALDGLRLYFDNNDILHLRASGNAPQLRLYCVTDSQERADGIIRVAMDPEKGAIVRALDGLKKKAR